MMRGTVIIISALLKCFVLNHRLQKHMWVGIWIITVAMVIVASTSLFQPAPTGAAAVASNGQNDAKLGVILVILGCVAQGVQYVFEEKVMKVDNAPPLVIFACPLFVMFYINMYVSVGSNRYGRALGNCFGSSFDLSYCLLCSWIG
jgi:drug/metabolite transporter (DMT)-like permease